jgi:hypothetical protein
MSKRIRCKNNCELQVTSNVEDAYCIHDTANLMNADGCVIRRYNGYDNNLNVNMTCINDSYTESRRICDGSIQIYDIK